MTARVAYEFGGFRFEPDNLRLIHGDRVIPLTGKASDTLHVLVRHPDSVVSKETLISAVWPGVAVEDNNLNQQISALRKALGQNGGVEFIETVARRGYRFAGPVREVPIAPAPAVATAAPGLPAVAAESGPQPPAPTGGAPAARSPSMMLPVAVAFAAVAFLTATVLFGRQWQHRQQQIGKSREAVERANELMRKGDAQSAVAELQEAIRLNEANAKAYGVLAHALNKQRAGQPPREGGESASVTAARRGVALDRTCADCHGTLGLFLFMHDWKWREAETHLREAIRLGPAEEGIRPSYAIFLAATGRQAEALKEIDVAIAARPYEISWHSIRASIFYFDRRYVEALDAADRGLSLSATERSLWEWRAKALFMLGRGEEAVRALAQDTFASQSPELDRAVRDGGVDGGLRKLLAITDDWRSRVDHAWRRAGWRAMLGDQAGTFEEIEHAFDARIFPVIYIGVDPVYDLIRNDPRYARLLARVGLDQVLEASAGRPRRPPLPRG